MKKVLAIGLGNVGRALYDVINETNRYEVYGFDIDDAKTIHRLNEIPRDINVIHICYPYIDVKQFINPVINYVKMFNPELIVINSTIPPGTTFKVYKVLGIDVVHAPIRGIHSRMKEHLRFWTLYVGPVNTRAGLKAKEYLESLGFKVKVVKSPLETELGKLFETVYRALMIAFWQEMHRIARYFNADIAEIADFIADTHKVLGDRPVYYPGVIGGSCLIPNTLILKRCYSKSKFLDVIIESNELRKEEVKDPKVREEIEKIKRIWKQLIPKWYYGIK